MPLKILMFPFGFVSLFMVFFSANKVLMNQQSGEKLEKIADLPGQFKETSGLVYFNQHLITHNDMGGKAELYVLDTLGKQVNTIQVNNAINTDWEDLAQSKTHIYIGDFGNNLGNRKDLKILSVLKSGLKPKSSKSVSVDGTIEFSYPEQTDFSSGKDHNFDCEAFIFYQNNLYLFTKNRSSKSNTSIYLVPAKTGKHKARKLGDMQVPGLITGATIHEAENLVCLSGYNKKGKCFLVFVPGFSGKQVESTKTRLVELGNFDEIGQLEALDFTSKNRLYLSAEALKKQPASLYRFFL